MKEPKERDVSAEAKAFMDSVKGCNANDLVEILEGMIADVKENSYFAGIPEEEGSLIPSKSEELIAAAGKIDLILQAYPARKALRIVDICKILVTERYGVSQ